MPCVLVYAQGAVKFVGSGLSLRSTVERGVTEAHWLDQNGDLIQILVVQNYLFFGNSQSLLMYITTMFEEEEEGDNDNDQENSPQNGVYTLPPKPKYLVVDFSLITGMDTSAVDIMKEIISTCQSNRCKLFLAGLKANLKSNMLYAGVRPKMKEWAYTSDMETALAKAEDGLLSTVFHLEEKDETEQSRRRQRRLSESQSDGFVYSLQKIDEQHGLNTAEELRGFQEYTNAMDLDPGDILVRHDDHGLYFVETGLMNIQWSQGNTTRNFANMSLTDTASSSAVATAVTLQNQNSIGHMKARSLTVGREMSIWKETRAGHHHTEQSFRLARIGQGWIIGGIETANGMKRPGVHIAMSPCRLHHLPSSAIKQAETVNPKLAMSLYKMLSHLATKRQEMTIEQLGQHLRILNSPVPRLRGQGKSALAKLVQDSSFGHPNNL
jgi:CRP-like cAMP-binding protein